MSRVTSLIGFSPAAASMRSAMDSVEEPAEPTDTRLPFIAAIESMPEVIQPFTYLIPLRHALDVLRASFIKGSGFGELAVPLLALAGFAVAFFGTAIAATRRRITE